MISQDFIQKTKSLKTPFIVYDLDQVVANYQKITEAMPEVEVFYAMKCNPYERFIEILKNQGAGFEVASLAEAKQLLAQGVNPSKIMCLHTIKSPEFLRFLAKNQISIMAADSYEEIDKIATYAPGSKILPRVVVDNQGSAWDLNGKFGLETTQFPRFLQYIQSKGLDAHGITFHVGSQCENEANWVKALQVCNDVWEDASKVGIDLRLLSLGGGLPVQYRKPIPDLKKIGKLVWTEFKQNFKSKYSVKVTIEPGRAIAATAGILVTQVFGLAKRGRRHWAYIEVGTYNGLIEAIETSDRNFYPLEVEYPKSKSVRYNIGGPSCVSLDTPFENVRLPKLELGDRLYILNTGAYCGPYIGANFNGFQTPDIYYLQDL